MARSLVLLSAGLDSTVNLQCARDRGDVTAALTFDYGQRAARRETAAAAAMCARAGLRHEIIRLPWLARITPTALVRRRAPLPLPSRDRLDETASKTAARVWVPNRNGVFLAIAAAYAEALGADQVVPGFNAEEAAAFPDNSTEFIRAVNQSLRLSTRSRVRVTCYTARKRKAAILRLGLKIHAPLDLVWCCYQGGRRMCGRCESCLRFLRAVETVRCADWFREHHRRLPAQPADERRRP